MYFSEVFLRNDDECFSDNNFLWRRPVFALMQKYPTSSATSKCRSECDWLIIDVAPKKIQLNRGEVPRFRHSMRVEFTWYPQNEEFSSTHSNERRLLKLHWKSLVNSSSLRASRSFGVYMCVNMTCCCRFSPILSDSRSRIWGQTSEVRHRVRAGTRRRGNIQKVSIEKAQYISR